MSISERDRQIETIELSRITRIHNRCTRHCPICTGNTVSCPPRNVKREPAPCEICGHMASGTWNGYHVCGSCLRTVWYYDYIGTPDEIIKRAIKAHDELLEDKKHDTHI